MTDTELFDFDLNRLIKKTTELKKYKRMSDKKTMALKAIRTAYREIEDAETMVLLSINQEK